jgi:hypothetical protein
VAALVVQFPVCMRRINVNYGEFVMFSPVKSLTAAALAVTVIGSAFTPALAQDRTRVGTLDCDISAGLGLIVASQKRVRCMFTPNQPGPREVYFGTISKVGIDIGGTTGGRMVWAVYAPSSKRFAALSGNYAGGNAEATVGLGAGANVLFGGSDRTISLQPVSIQGQTGLNLAVAVADLELHRAR